MNEDALLYDDTHCLLKMSGGDEYFFNLIFEKYRNRLFAYLFKVTKSRETAEEIVLDVFLKLWHGREAVTEIENLEAFLFRVAHNKAIDFFRAAKRNPTMQQEIWESITEAISYETADKKLLDKNLEAIVESAVNQLSPQRKKVYYLRNSEDLSYGEIASALNLSSNTVRNHLAASVQFIKEFLLKNDVLKLMIAFYVGKKF
jgi:RNA polymerase sigma-70 factor (ECF subfamily)